MNEELQHALTLDGLIDGNTDDDLGKALAPIRDYLRKIGSRDHVAIELGVDELPSNGGYKEIATVDVSADDMKYSKFFISARFKGGKPSVRVSVNTRIRTVDRSVTGMRR